MGFFVVDATDWELAGDENEGATPHDWLRSSSDGEMYLWKPAADGRLQRREHLAEKLVSHLAVLFGVPAATVRLATREGTVGCLSRDLQPRKTERRSGAQLLRALDPSFRPDDRTAEAYTIENIARVLEGVGPPHDAGDTFRDFTAFEVFAGYLVFDALVLNRDRHAANWAVWQPRDGGRSQLSALFDNASSLALSMSEDKAGRRLAGAGVAEYTRREDHARRFTSSGSGNLRLIEVARAALGRCRADVRAHWTGRVAAVQRKDVVQLVDAVDELSDVMRTLVVEVVMCTQERWLHEL